MKKAKTQNDFLEQLRKVPIVQVACEKVGLSRQSVYRWRNNDPVFKKQMDEALIEGETLINDLSETQLVSLIKDRNWPAISFWLKHRNPKFRERVEVTAINGASDDVLSLQQEEQVRKALAFGAFKEPDK